MKVLLIAPLPKKGGPKGGIGSVTENMIRFLENNKQNVQWVLYNTLHKIRPITSGSLLVRLYTGITNSFKTCYKALQIIKTEKPDVIHVASSSSLALIRDYIITLLAGHFKIPVVMHWHFGRIPYLANCRNREWTLLKKVIRRSTISVVIDPQSLKVLQQQGFSNVLYIPNPMDPDIENKLKERINHKKSFHGNSKVIFVGHVIKEKGVFELVESCSKICCLKELILVGSYSKQIREKLLIVAARKEGNWLKFSGQLDKDQVLQIMADAPVLVLPSYTEGFPMVIIEAMAMGCAIVATDVGAIPEILAIADEKPCGICVPPRNAEKIEEAILKLLHDTDYMEVLGKRGMERVIHTYNSDVVNSEYMIAWNKAIHQAARTTDPIVTYK